MSRIDDLIRDLCPDGVEYKPLGELVEIFSGHAFNSTHFNKIKTGLPLIRIRDINTGFSDTYYSGPYQNKYVANSGDLLIGMDGDFHIVHWSQGKALLNQRVCRLQNINSELDKRFLFHIMTPILKHIQNESIKSTVKHLSVKQLHSAQIPLPPLEVQKEIAKTLDQFTQLEAELEAELEARQQQYAYYRDILVAPRSPRESVKLGKVSRIARGASPRPIRKFITNDGGIPWIKIGDVPPQGKHITTTAQHISTDGAEKSRQIKPGDFILSNSMSFGRPYISKINGCIHDGWLVISNYEKTFDPDFLYHVLRSSPIQNGFAQRAGSGTVRNLNSRIVSETLVPAPPIDQQREIVHLLDKFDLLVNDLTSGLPAEIEARHKQYEYYRDRLLTFPEKN